jgi:glutamine amidotransferase
MQLLAQSSTEQGLWKGLELIEGKVERLASTGGLRIPHVGWNDVRFRESLMYQKLTSPQDYYFLHSFALMEDTESVNGTCDYGTPFVASLENGNIWGCQFHPEKSQSAGLQILKNFIDLAQC